MTSHDLLVPVQTTKKNITARVLLLEAQDIVTGEAKTRLQALSTAVRSNEFPRSSCGRP